MQQLIQRGGINAQDGFIFGDQAFFRHFHRHPQRRFSRPLAVTGLQHIKPTLLDGEFDILHIAIMLFKNHAGFSQLLEDFRHFFFHGQFFIAARHALFARQVARRSDAGDHVFALGIDQKFTIEHVLARRRIAREGHPRGAVIAHIAKDHGLNIHRRSPKRRDAIEAAIGDGALVHPTVKHRANCPP